MAWNDSADLRDKMAALEALFFSSLQVPDPNGAVARLAVTTTIDSESLTLAWNDLIGSLREWVGERVIKDLRARTITVTPKHYERTIGINKDHLADDKLGLCMENMRGLASLVQQDYRRKVVERLMAAFTDIGWDGKAILANDHPKDDGTTIDNLTSDALDATGLANAIQYFDSLVGVDGEPLYVQPDLLACGPAQRANAEALLKADRLASGATNVNFQRLDLLVDPGITSNNWFVLCTNGPVKPIRLVTRKLAEVRFDEPFGRNEYLAGVDARHAAVWTSYQFVWGSDG